MFEELHVQVRYVIHWFIIFLTHVAEPDLGPADPDPDPYFFVMIKANLRIFSLIERRTF
jgi:hypothetical protein